MKPESVLCWNEKCNWKGRKARRTECNGCGCEDGSTGCQCPPFGPCPKCGGRVNNLKWIRDWRKNQARFHMNQDGSRAE